MPIISVQLLTGRDTERKRALVRELAEAAVRALDVPIASVRIILHDVTPESWGVGGETKGDLDARTAFR